MQRIWKAVSGFREKELSLQPISDTGTLQSEIWNLESEIWNQTFRGVAQPG